MTLQSERITLSDSFDAVNDWFYEQRLTDGLPIVPPTAERVEAMLAWTDRDPAEELGEVPTKFGIATVEKVAVNAVMAGCKPEYLPVIITIVQALLEKRFNLDAVQATTHPCSPLIILNGPIARELEVNSRHNCFGPGWRANATIGRATRLIQLNIGGALPGGVDHATHGQPSKYTYCMAENEEANPWEPLHVERGFDRETSTVTVCPAENPHELNDHVNGHAPGLLTTLASGMAGMGSNNAYMGGDPVLCLGPEHAAVLANDGLSKDDIRSYIFTHARVPREMWITGGLYGIRAGLESIFPGEDAIPLTRHKEDLIIIVAGGEGRHSLWMPTFGDMTLSVTKPIVLKNGTPAKSIQEFKRSSGSTQPT